MRRIVALLLLSSVLIVSAACNPFSEGSAEETEPQEVEVIRGDLTLSVSGSGNIDTAQEDWLTFGSNGRIDKIFVNENDEVTEGEVLAKLEAAPLELALTQAQLTQVQAQVARTQAQVALDQAEYNLDKAQDVYEWPEIRTAQLAVDDTQSFLEYAQRNLENATKPSDIETWTNIVDGAEAALSIAEDILEAILEARDPDEVAIIKLQIEAAKSQLESADLQLQVAGQALAEALKQLDRATITAPFDGVVASTGADEGDTVSAATSIVYLIDLSIMELKAGVDEIDIPIVKVGQRAIIDVDALPRLPLEGEVSSISLIPREEAGLIVYDVTISFSTAETGVKVGMGATVDIIIDERNNVLLVPERAIRQDSQGNPVVKVVVDEQIQERQVVPGISDGFQAEIVSGLQEGEVVVVERRAGAESSDSGGFFF